MQPIPSFLGKCQQLHETARVRHGIVIIGSAMSGKTSIIRALSRATTALSRKRSETTKVALSAIGIVKDAVDKSKRGHRNKKKSHGRRGRSQEPASGAGADSSKRRTRSRRNSNTIGVVSNERTVASSSSNSIAPVRLRVINPKAISLQELFGQGEESTGEWEDGVLAVTMRACARDTSGDRKWILFDGPVDTLWIENMNTVLDDTKKLCLPNG